MNTDTTKIHRRSLVDATQTPLHPQPLLHRLLASRGVRSAEELNFSLQSLPDPSSMLGVTQAVALLSQALRQNRQIMVIGDYDADGATSTAVSVCALRTMGARRVSFLIPNRFEYGYGLSVKIVELAIAQGAELIVTVDNGIASVDGVAAAKAAGLQVLITDHHLAPQQLPAADAIVNPNQADDDSGYGNLAGVGVVFFVMLALRRHLHDSGWFEQHGLDQPKLATLLDLVALGTVADVVKLDALNRILVEQGLRRMRAGRARPGINAILQVAGVEARSLCSTDLGFVIGPRLNAAGRISDMRIGVQCLLSEHLSEALLLARQLDDLNRQRRQIEQTMRAQADELIRSTHLRQEQTKNSVCLHDSSWHEGVIGIVAGRLKDQLYRPVVVFANSEQGQIKGSGRSIPGVHLRDVLDSIAGRNPGLIEKFGGHAMAAGLSLAQQDLQRFSAAFEHEVTRLFDDAPPSKTWHSDGELKAEHFDLQLAHTLRFLAPWGQGFPEPLFDGRFIINHARIVGEKHLKLRVRAIDSNTVVDAIAFNQAGDELPTGEVQLVYRLDINEFRQQQSIQLRVEAIF